MKDIIILMRPKHWIKNILVFIPAFFSRILWEPEIFWNLILGLFCFSFVSSMVYIFNDLKDMEKDKRHKVKCRRPLASGLVSKKTAICIFWILGVMAFVCGCFIQCGQEYIHRIWCVLYLVLNIAYSTGLKNLPIIDVAILAAGFIIRILYGAAISEVTVSVWLCLTVMSFTLYMAIGKRRNELQRVNGNLTREVLQYYDISLLDRYMTIMVTLGIVFYSFWAGIVMEGTLGIWTVPLILFIIMKYEMIIRGNSYGDPVEVLLSDKVLCGMVLFYIGIMVIVMY